MRYRERGDTIIEVLIAMTVIGITFSIGFSIANSALQTGRTATERGEALKIAETQLELVKASLSDSISSPDVFKVATPYCVVELNVAEPNPVITPLGRCNSFDDTFYNLRMDYTAASGGNPASYKSSVTWEVPNSTAPAVVEIFYRPYDGN